MKTLSSASVLAVLVSSILSVCFVAQTTSHAQSMILVDGNTPGYYNNALGTILDGSAPQFPLPLGAGGSDPLIYPATEPDLASATNVLGNWLTPHALLNANWQSPATIPATWAGDTETAIIYEISGGLNGFTNLFGDFDADNGLYVWVNGQFKFGARAPGLPSPAGQFEYTNVFLGNLAPGTNRIQVLREDNFDATGYQVRIVGSPITNQPPTTSAIPIINSFTPPVATNGSNVNILGLNFSPIAASNLVYFGAIQANVTAASSNLLIVNVPTGATHSPITVTVNGLTAKSRSAFLPTFVGNGSNISPNSFAPGENLTVADGPLKSIIADLDGDGKPDLLEANAYAHNISVFRNIGAAGTLNGSSFAPRVDFPSLGGTDSPRCITVADVDGDGKLDLLVGDQASSSVLVYRNLSTPGTLTTGSFAAPISFAAGSYPHAVHVADLNRDGLPEILVANYLGNSISILRNLGPAGTLTTNSFAAQYVMAVEANPTDVAVADLNGDGRPDLVTTAFGGTQLSVFRNVAISNAVVSNWFTLDTTLPALPGSLEFAVADMDGDAKSDLVVASVHGYAVSVYRNLASGGIFSSNSFAARVDFGTPGWAHNVSVGDFNGDAKPDLAISGELNSYMAVFQNQSTPGSFTTGSLAARVDYATGWNAWGVAAGDLDGDSRADIVFANTYDDTLTFYRNIVPFSDTNNPPASCVNPPIGIAGWWRAEGNPADAIGTNIATLLNGTGFGSGMVGQGFTFDGLDDSVRIPAEGLLDIGIGAGLTIETWINPTRLTIGPIVEWNNGAGGEGMHLWHSVDTVIAGDGPGNIYGNLVDTAGVSHPIVSPSGLLLTNTFSHVALTYDKTTGIAVIYHNGVVVRTQNLGIFTPRTSDDLHFGRRPSGPFSGDLFQGQIDEVSLYNRALTAPEIQAIAAAGSAGKCVGTNPPITCIPSLPDNVGWWRAESNTVDSISGNVGVPQGALTYAPGEVNQAFVLNGAGSGVRIEGSEALDVGRQAGMTVEAWIYPTDITSGGPIVEWSRDSAGSPYGAHLWAGHPSRSPGYFFANLADTNGGWHVIEKDGALATNTYQHVAVTYDQSTGVARLYVNGVIVQESNLGTFAPRTSDHLFIGRRPTGDFNDYSFAGQIDEVSIYRRALTPTEILAIYNANSAGKCPPTFMPPGITQQPRSIVTNVNANVRFDVIATGMPAPSYQWFFGSNVLAGQTSSMLLLNNIQTSQAGEYFVIATNNFGAVTSSVATLTVLTFPPVITRQPTNLTVIESNLASFTVQATGSVTLAYQWLFNSQPMASRTAATLTFNSAQFSNAGNYSVIVANPYGAVTSSVATLTVNPRPPCAPVHDGLVSWWKGENNTLDNWDSNNGTSLLGASSIMGKVGSAWRIPLITVNDSPSLRMTNGLTIESWINPITLTSVRVILAKFEYPLNQPSGTQSAYLLGTTNDGTLFFTLTPNGSVRTNTTLLTTNRIPLNQWSHVAATYDGSVMRLYINGNQIGQTNYTGKIFPGSAPLGICGFPGGTSSPWQFSGFVDEVSLYNRALSATEIQSIFNADLTGKCLAPPVITQQPQGQAVPLGEDVKLTTTVSGSRPLTYRWKLNGTNILNATNAFLVIEKIKANQTGLYSLAVTNSLGFDVSAPAQISLLPAPSCTEMLPGLISWWPGNGNNLDVVGPNNISTYSPLGYPTGKVASAFTFNGSNSRIVVNNNNSLNFGANTNFSIEMWIKANPTNTTYPNVPLLEKRTTPTTWIGYSLSLNQGRLAFALGTPSIAGPAGVSSYVSTGPDLRDAMFHHVAVTVNRSTTNGGVLYVDGVPVLTFNPVPRNETLVNTSQLFIGAPTTVEASSYFSGLIDEPAIYNRALTAAEILSIRTAGAAGRCTAPPVIVTHPVGASVTNGASLSLSVVATGSPLPRYQWRRNTQPLNGATNSFLNLTNISISSTGSYSVIVSNVFGSVISSNAVVTLSNRPPNAVPTSVSVTEDSPGVMLMLTGNDPEGRPLTFAIVTPPTNGVIVNTTGTTRFYRPNPNYHGPDSFTFKVNDGFLDSAPATVSITVRPVNDAPVAQSQLVTTDEDVPVVITLQAFDVDGDLLYYCLTDCSPFLVTPPSHGTLSGVAPNLIYTPETNYFGEDLFTFVVTDSKGGFSQIAAVSITVNPVNDAPAAKIVVTPLDELPGVTNTLAIAPACCDATLRLDASESTDIENDPLSYLWLEGTNVLSTAITTTNRFPAGTHEITLLVSDGASTNIASVIVEVITPAEAVGFLNTLVEASISEPRLRNPLLNWLRQATEAFENCQVEQGVHFLQMFKQRIEDRVAPVDAELATGLINTVNPIIEAAPDCDPSLRLGRNNNRGRNETRDDRSNSSGGRSPRP